MRSSNKSRSRNKPGNNGQNNNQRRPMGNIVNRVFESAGPDGKVRGTPQQIIDKYQALARDAQVAGDRVAAENYLQHSEHYSRLLGEAQRQQSEQRFGNERDDAPRGDEQDSEQRVGGQGGGPREQQGNNQPGAPREQRPRPVPSFGLQTFEPEEADFGPIPTPESGEPQPRLTAPAAEYQPAEYQSSEYQPAESLADDPRDTGFDPRGAEVEPEPAPAAAEEASVPEAPAVETTVAEAPVVEAQVVEAQAEPVVEAPAPVKRPRTRRKKAEPAPVAEAPEEAKPAGDTAEAQPAEPI